MGNVDAETDDWFVMTETPHALVPELESGLRRFGFSGFRPGQQEAIETLIERGRLLLVAPTGGGKSLTYQLPATLLPGTALVISPLIALMHDQVSSLEALGVPATFLAATLDGAEARRRMAGIAAGAFKLVYVAPERLVARGFRQLVHDIDLSLVAIDEAHCISEWGHDFRPEYLQIGHFIESVQPPRVLACTATATPVVRDEILTRLQLPADTPQIVRGFARPNLSLRVEELRSAKQRERAVDGVLTETLGRPDAGRGAAIIYGPTRKSTEVEASRLNGLGWAVAAYHAGLSPTERESVQRRFSSKALDVVVATNAFGMGIDRGDVRLVVHLAPPGSMEAYYQEVGRAGRDGAAAVGLLLTTPNDMPLRRRLIERSAAEAGLSPALLEHKWGLFLELMRWAEGGSCRHDAVLRYFGDDAETLHGCGRCDVCQQIDDGDGPSEEESALFVRKALSGIARIHGKFGMMAAVNLLRGVADTRLARYGLQETRTFGVLNGCSEDWTVKLLRRCVSAGWVDFSGGEHPVVHLTDTGIEVMQGRRPARLLLPRQASTRRSSAATRPPPDSTAKRAEAVELTAEQAQVFEGLRQFRLERARADGVPPYVVASDRTLRDIAILMPRSVSELGMAYGMGRARIDKYGEAMIRLVAKQGSQ